MQLDFSAVEPTVLAEFSKCPNYRKLYGPEANPNQDVYLFVGARFRPFTEKFRQYYDPDNPTAEGTALAKKIFKTERAISKECHLAMQYGAFPPTVHGALVRKEVDIELEEVQEMHQVYWSPELFAVVKEFNQKLDREWNKRGGWIVNGLGRPLAVAENKKKDLLNRYCQSMGHDLLQKYIRYLDEGRRELRAWPWIVDFHDETVWEVQREDTPAFVELMNDSMDRLNRETGWEIQIRGKPEVAHNLAQIKCEGYRYGRPQ